MAAIEVSLLTGGADRPYAFGLTKALMGMGAGIDLVGNNDLDCPEFRNAQNVKLLNLRGDQRTDAGALAKMLRVLRYYVRLIRYSAIAEPKLFHVLWNNKFEYFDRTLLMVWYRLLGKSVILTLHNVNARRRDKSDSILNRLTLRIQYRLADHVFVHTEKMRLELIEEFAGRAERITVIPFGINNAVPNTQVTREQAREKLGIESEAKTILFFGHIAPYKGLEILVDAFNRIASERDVYKLVIAGRPKNCPRYWSAILEQIGDGVEKGKILLRDEFIPDEDTELYMKAADVLVLPYRHVYQSGVLFLGYSFGLPVLAADVGSLSEEVEEGRTGFVFRPEDPAHLAGTIEHYFRSDLYADLSGRRSEIREYAMKRHSWEVVGQMTVKVYKELLHRASGKTVRENGASPEAGADVN